MLRNQPSTDMRPPQTSEVDIPPGAPAREPAVVARQRLPHWVILVTGSLTIVLGLVVLAEWYTQHPLLRQMTLTVASMPHTTAWGFLLCGSGLLALAVGRLRVVAACGTVAAAFGLLTLIAYVFGVDLGIDQLLMRRSAATAAMRLERIVPSAALCFTLTGATLLYMSTWRRRETTLPIPGLGGAIVLALGLVASFGYLAGFKEANSGGDFPYMPLPTAIGCVGLGGGLIACTWRQGRPPDAGASRWVMALIGVSIVTVTLGLWQALLVEERANITWTTQVQTVSVQNEITARMEARIVPLMRMGRRWEKQGRPEKEMWVADAGLHLSDHPSLQVIAWVDPSLHVRWVVPSEGNAAAQDLDLGAEERRQQVLTLAGGRRAVTTTRALDLGQDVVGFQIVVPIFRGDELEGFIVGAFRVRELLDSIVGNMAPGYGMAVFDGKDEIYRRVASDQPPDSQWAQKASISLYGVNWQLWMWPAPGLLAEKFSPLPTVVLVWGLLTAVLLMVAVHLAQTARLRTLQVETANQELHNEIVERQRAEDQVQRQQEALYQREKLAAMGSLLASVAHELNNPLAVVMVQADLLREEAEETPLAERATKITQAAERSVHIVKNFLAMVRQRSPERTRVCLNEVIKAAMDLLAYPLRVDNVDVSLQLADHLPILCADPHQFQQVVVNLITNAHQAMQETPLPRRLTLTTWADLATSRVHLTVADTGPGIPAALQARIFEPFFTTKPPGVGTGLGLSLCQGIIESHGGTLRVESAPGHGTVFHIECPVEAVPMPVPTALPVETLVQMPERSILVVDDEPGITGALAYLLDRDGHQVETAANGRIALERLQERDYDLLLSDLRMPELDGLGLYKEIEHRHPHMLSRMIFLTGDTLSPETMDLLDTMGAPRLNKPFTAAEVRRVVQRALMEQVIVEHEG